MAAPRPASSSLAAPRRGSVQANAVKEVIMPALSSTMTEGKVRLFSVSRICRWEEAREASPSGGREREGKFGSLRPTTLVSLARFGPVAKASQGARKIVFLAPLFLSLNESRIRCFFLRNWSKLILSNAPGEESKCEKSESSSKREDERFFFSIRSADRRSRDGKER